ncbi:MAG TPA: amidohydrolase family protein [Candidatus Acidoferrum sp.]|nr:amidohydrolase family protein [Candidatus Acidoferrum sp.]
MVGPSDRVLIPAGVRVIDGSGKFLIPGFWDMHGHLTDATEEAFPLLIMNGVTGVRDMGGDLTQIDRWRSEIDKGLRVGPHIIRAGPFVDGPKEGVSNRLTVRTAEEARQAVHNLKAKGVDFIKIHNTLPPDAFLALMDEARKEHIPVAVHLPKGVSSAEASEAGVASLEHIETIRHNNAVLTRFCGSPFTNNLETVRGGLGMSSYAEDGLLTGDFTGGIGP